MITCMNNKDKNMKNFLSSQDRNIKIIINGLRYFLDVMKLPVIYQQYLSHISCKKVTFLFNIIVILLVLFTKNPITTNVTTFYTKALMIPH